MIWMPSHGRLRDSAACRGIEAGKDGPLSLRERVRVRAKLLLREGSIRWLYAIIRVSDCRKTMMRQFGVTWISQDLSRCLRWAADHSISRDLTSSMIILNACPPMSISKRWMNCGQSLQNRSRSIGREMPSTPLQSMHENITGPCLVWWQSTAGTVLSTSLRRCGRFTAKTVRLQFVPQPDVSSIASTRIMSIPFASVWWSTSTRATPPRFRICSIWCYESGRALNTNRSCAP